MGQAGSIVAKPYDPLIALYRLPLRHPDTPPDEVIRTLDEELPGVSVALEPDQSAVMCIQEEATAPLLDAKVTAAVRRVAGAGTGRALHRADLKRTAACEP